MQNPDSVNLRALIQRRARSALREDPLLAPDEAAPYIGVTRKTLENWRSIRDPRRTIPYVKVGRLVYYRKSVLDAFLARCERDAEGPQS